MRPPAWPPTTGWPGRPRAGDKGDKGDEGDTGNPGAFSDIEYVTVASSVADDATITTSAVCPASYIAISGGHRVTNTGTPTGLVVASSRPDRSTAGNSVPTAGQVEYEIYATCVKG